MNCLNRKCVQHLFHTTTTYRMVSQQAKIIMKIMGGTNKKNTRRVLKDEQPSTAIPDFLGGIPSTSTKVAKRRVAIMNSIYLEKITEIMASSNLNTDLHQYGFLITKVKYEKDGTALNVYWTADSHLSIVKGMLSQIGGKLRHDLSELQNSKVPHINFVYDRSICKATDVEELLKIADFGIDYSPSNPNSKQNSTLGLLEVETRDKPEKLIKCSDILGVDRDAIINQVKKSMHHVPETRSSKQTAAHCDIQRRIDFKQYLKTQEILRSKMERRLSRDSRLHDEMLLNRREDVDDCQEDNVLLEREQDFFEDEIEDATQSKN